MASKRKRSEIADWLTGREHETRQNGYGEGKREKREKRDSAPRRGGYRR